MCFTKPGKQSERKRLSDRTSDLVLAHFLALSFNGRFCAQADVASVRRG